MRSTSRHRCGSVPKQPAIPRGTTNGSRPGREQSFLDPQDLEVAVGGDVGYAQGLQHMTGTKTDGEEVDLWFRATACFRREDGGWRITHMHNSVLFSMDGSGKALLSLRP